MIYGWILEMKVGPYRSFEGPYMTRREAEDRAANLRELYDWVIIQELEAAV